MNLDGKIACITGASRGIGLAIAKKLAAAGVEVILLAKSMEAHPKLEGTLPEAVREIEELGGQARAFRLDVRNEEDIADVFRNIAGQYPHIDFLINNASAIFLAGTEHVPAKRFDLMHQVNVRGTFLVTQQALPLLKKADGAHILNLSPPLSLEPRWFANHLAYTMSKYGMSMCVLGWAEEFREYKIAANALWPETIIATAAVQNLLGGDAAMQQSRKPEIVADAAMSILVRDPTKFTGRFCIDTEILTEDGISDFSAYQYYSGSTLLKDLFLE